MSIRTDPTSSPVRTDNSSSNPASQRPLLGLSLPQVTGGALAAATSAVALSFFGVAGTLIGAVVGSLVATIGAAVYSHSLGVAAAQLRVVRVAGRPDANGVGDDRTDVDPASGNDTASADPAPVGEVTAKPTERRWLRLATGVALGVVLALAGITAVELILGHPVSGSTTSGTTIGQAVGGQREASSATLAPSPTSTKNPAAAPATTATATSESTPSATKSAFGAATDTPTGSVSTSSPAGPGATVVQPAG